MSDEELAAALDIPIELVSKLTPAQRRSYENLEDAYQQIRLWEMGVGPLPAGVIVCKPHRKWSKR